jgi:hypothetical protein
MIPGMQVGLFFPQTQTFRNFLAAVAGVPANHNLTDRIRTYRAASRANDAPALAGVVIPHS